MSNINNELLKEDLRETIDKWNPDLWHEYYMGRATLGQIMDAVEEEFQRRSTVQRQEDNYLTEMSWRCGYDYLHEGALGDF